MSDKAYTRTTREPEMLRKKKREIEKGPPEPIDPVRLVHIRRNPARRTFITSDLHLFHSNIIKFCHRPYHVVGPNSNPENIASVDQMNKDILALFDKLPLDCDVWNLGDLFYPLDRKVDPVKFRMMKTMVAKMKGEGGRRRLLLILGNHDVGQFPDRPRRHFYLKLGFDEVYDAPVVVDDKYLLSHIPEFLEKGSPLINLYGHLHDQLLREIDFCIDYDKYKKQIKIAEREGRERPEMEISWPEREVDLANYRSMCLDSNKGILEWSGDTFTVVCPIWTE